MSQSILFQQRILLILIPTFIVFPLFPKALAQDNDINGRKFAPSGIDWNTLCTDLSQMNILLHKCSQLVNSNGTLTLIGATTMECIKSILSLGIGAILHGTSLSSAVFSLGLLAQSTGCGNAVNMNHIQSPTQFRFLTQAFNLQ